MLQLTQIILLKAVLMAVFILFSPIGLGPDEAQYWTWSKSLAFGYYSKPPGIAWQIFLGSFLFGDTVFGVRFFSIILSIAISYAVYALAFFSGAEKKVCLWSGAAFALCPLGIFSSFFATTDGGLTLFWTLSFCTIAFALYHTKPIQAYLLAFFIALGALFKWPIFFVWFFVFSLLPFYPFLKSRRLAAGFFLSFLGLAPSIYWNFSNDFATFKHVFETVVSTKSASAVFSGNFFDFLAAQSALLSPALFVLLLLSFAALVKNRKKTPRNFAFLGTASFLILSVYLLLSLFKKMQGNWCVFAYPSAIVFLCWFSMEKLKNGKLWLGFSLALSLVLCFFTLSIPFLQKNAFANIPYKFNPFKHNLGWENLSQGLASAGYRPGEHFLFGDKYQTSSILSFYGSKEKHRAYFLNLLGTRKNQFSFWPGMEKEQIGNTGFFVFSENMPYLEKELNQNIVEKYVEKLSPFFETVEFARQEPLFISNGKLAKAAFIYKCSGYNGKTPQSPDLY